MATWYIGTMGFGYRSWQGAFYPEGLPKAQQLTYYAGRFNALEMDSTFYGTPKADTVDNWQAQTPSDFVICPKAPREVTHDLRLAAAGGSFGAFLDTLGRLGLQLGPVVLQFPPDYTVEERDNLSAFLAELPADMRFAVELRHRSWWSEATADMFRAHDVAWVAADYIYLPKELRRTTDFLYLRFLGRHGQFADKSREVLDKTDDLQRWLAQIEPHLDTVDAVYAFFNDDYAGHAPTTAARLMAMLGLQRDDGLPRQPRLL